MNGRKAHHAPAIGTQTVERLIRKLRRTAILGPTIATIVAVRIVLDTNLFSVLKASDDLRLPKYRGNKNVYKGHCYICSEVLYHAMGGKNSGLTPHVMRVRGDTHWFLVDKDGQVYDPTWQQFKKMPNYSKSRACGFLTKEPSKRAKELLRRINA